MPKDDAQNEILKVAAAGVLSAYFNATASAIHVVIEQMHVWATSEDADERDAALNTVVEALWPTEPIDLEGE